MLENTFKQNFCPLSGLPSEDTAQGPIHKQNFLLLAENFLQNPAALQP